MKWLLKKKFKFYRKYSSDLWGFILKKGKINKLFKLFVILFNLKNIKKFFIRYKKKKFFALKNYNKMKTRQLNISKTSTNFFVFLKKWKTDFIEKFKKNYFFKLKKFKDKKNVSHAFWSTFHNRSRTNKYFKGQRYYYLYVKYKRLKLPLVAAAKRLITSRQEAKTRKRRKMSYHSWLPVKHLSKYNKRYKNWWGIRISQRKAAIFYAIPTLQKFRYIVNLQNKAMPLVTFYMTRLETMLSTLLFRLNLFDTIKIASNFIKLEGVILNGKKVSYPSRFVKINSIINIDKKNFKKLFNIFLKKTRYNKSWFVKKVFYSKTIRFALLSNDTVLTLSKNIFNNPPYIEANYKVMHFILWRLPKKKEFIGQQTSRKSYYNWSISTQLQYY